MLSLTLVLADAEALRTVFERELALGRAFVPGACDAEALTPCCLVLEHGGRSHRLQGEVVFVKAEGPGSGVGVALTLNAEAREALRGFVDASIAVDAASAVEAPDEPPPSSGEHGEPLPLHALERIRALTAVEQQRLAAGGTLSERMALERMVGSTVWETLLRNPRLTVPEVARIARKGTLPRPLVDAIAANASWLAAGEVQRALLSNPRCSPSVVDRVLRGMSRSDLQLVPQQTAYPGTVRQAAKRLLGR